jgi:hypothetical protein
MLLEKTIPVYAEDHVKPLKTNAQLLMVNASGTNIYLWALKVKLSPCNM